MRAVHQRRQWARRADSIHRKAELLMSDMVRALGEEHPATDAADNVTVETAALSEILSKDTLEMWKTAPRPPPLIFGAKPMGENSAIEWCDHTFNPWIGCTNVSPACDNCYAEDMMDHRYGRVTWGAGEDRVRTSPANWAKPRQWDRKAQEAGTRPCVFCSSLADVFDNEVDPLWRADLFKLIEATPNLVWLLLTKRIGNVLKMTDIWSVGPCLPPNVAVGATMANQEEYDRDASKLNEVKLRRSVLFTFGSFEPLLGPIMLDDKAPDWIIVGGESGRNARPMNIAWASNLQHQAERLGRVFNFKQVGGRTSDKGGHLLHGSQYFARPSVPPISLAA
jgi:protein gp37